MKPSEPGTESQERLERKRSRGCVRYGHCWKDRRMYTGKCPLKIQALARSQG